MSDDKKWFRSSYDGELGWLMERDGKQYIQLNRPMEELLRPYGDGSVWIPEVEHRPLSKAQLAKVCFEADKELCRSLGLHANAKKEWQDLDDKQRIAWMETGPTKNVVRAGVWKALTMVLEPLTR